MYANYAMKRRKQLLIFCCSVVPWVLLGCEHLLSIMQIFRHFQISIDPEIITKYIIDPTHIDNLCWRQHAVGTSHQAAMPQAYKIHIPRSVLLLSDPETSSDMHTALEGGLLFHLCHIFSVLTYVTCNSWKCDRGENAIPLLALPTYVKMYSHPTLSQCEKIHSHL